MRPWRIWVTLTKRLRLSSANPDNKESNILWTILVILLILWLLGLMTGYTMGGVIHILPAIAIVVVPARVIMTAEKTRTIPLPPIVGGISLVGGIVLLVVGKKKG